MRKYFPGFKEELRKAAYEYLDQEIIPSAPDNLDKLVSELEVIGEYVRENSSNKILKSKSSGESYFDASSIAMLNFLMPKTNSSGPSILRDYITLHSPDAGNFVQEIINMLDVGKTIILDLGNATDSIRKYFSDLLSIEVFKHQEIKFTSNTLKDSFIQLYFEEAHNLFPKDDNNFTGIYARFAKEGAKFHIGMVYSTQSPSTINRELLAQTENFFIAHISSQYEVDALAKLQIQFNGVEQDILRTRTPGYMRIITFSHRFVIPVQVNKFEASIN